MRPIDKFILHVVHNLFPLNEYSEGAIKQIMQQYREEADDLNIQITDEQLKKYIERFDVIKAGLISKGKTTDIVKQGAGGKLEVILPLSKLIKLVTTSKGGDIEDEKEDDTPDVVYNENNKIIWNGSKEGNCVTYGRDEKWCITRGSYGAYRYSSDKGYPTFYLAKNNNLADSNPLSFVAIQVRDPEKKNNNDIYVYTGRNNRPYESKPMSFSRLTSEIPWLKEIPNIESILKYIPLTSTEKLTQQYKFNVISIREWIKLPFEIKKQYLVIRQDKTDLFSDISTKIFVKNYLPEYPQIAEFIAITPGIIEPITLLANLESFNPQDRRSITANLQGKIDTDYLNKEILPFNIKKLLVTLDKWDIKFNERIYVTKDGNIIVKLNFTDDDVSIGLYTEEDDYPKIKLNQRTSKYLLDYPELDKISLKNLVKLAWYDKVIDKSVVTKVIDDAKDNPNSALIVKPTEDGEIVLDSNSFSSYKVDKNGDIVPIAFNNEEVQQIFTGAKDNKSFQQNALNLFKTDPYAGTGENIPQTIDKDALISVINAIPYNQRIVQIRNTPSIVLSADTVVVKVSPSQNSSSFFLMPATVNPNQQRTIVDYGNRGNDWRRIDTSNNLSPSLWKSYFAYLRATNQVYDAEGLKILLSGWQMSRDSKKAFVQNNPPIANNSRLKPAMNGNIALLINTANPRESFKISDKSNKLVKANISPTTAVQLLGQAAPAAAAATAPAGRRGRPAGVPNAPRAAAQPAAAGDVNVATVMENARLTTAFMRLPRADYRRLAVVNAAIINPNGDRGAARRNNQLGNRGRVIVVVALPGGSKIYIIRLANDQKIASINIQPGNRNYVLFGNEQDNVALPLNSPAELLGALQQRNLAEIHNYLVNEYLGANPNHLTEFKQLLRKHINEKKNEQK